jgi:hypothetical protein
MVVAVSGPTRHDRESSPCCQRPVAGAGGGVTTVGCGRRGLAIIVGSTVAPTLAVPLVVAFAARC